MKQKFPKSADRVRAKLGYECPSNEQTHANLKKGTRTGLYRSSCVRPGRGRRLAVCGSPHSMRTSIWSAYLWLCIWSGRTKCPRCLTRAWQSRGGRATPSESSASTCPALSLPLVSEACFFLKQNSPTIYLCSIKKLINK